MIFRFPDFWKNLCLMLKLSSHSAAMCLSLTFSHFHMPSVKLMTAIITYTKFYPTKCSCTLLTCGKPSSEENVEEFLWRNVSLEVSVEGSVVSVAAVAGVLGCIWSCSLISILIVLLPLLWITQHCVCITNCCWERMETFGHCTDYFAPFLLFVLRGRKQKYYIAMISNS